MTAALSFTRLYGQPWAQWLRRNVIVALVASAFVSAIFTYISISNSYIPLAIKPTRVWTLLALNLVLLVLLLCAIGVRVYKLWKELRIESAGSQLQKRVLVLFSVVSILPTIIVSIFSGLFFNLGIQTWFNERVQTAVEESLVVAEIYLKEHKENIRADAIAMANDLNQIASLNVASSVELSRIVNTQASLRLLTEALVFQHNRIIAQGHLSFALAFERISPDIMERASHGEAVIMDTDDDKVRALIKLSGWEDTYLMVGRLVDSKVTTHMQNAQGAVNEYNTLKSQMHKLQVTFSVVFVTVALLLLLASIGYGMVFAARLTQPISRLVMAAERVRGGDFSARVSDPPSKDEIGTLSRAFNRMTEQLQAQRGDLIEANRRIDERRRFSEAVLFGVSAGVIALDRDKKIILFNRSASSIFSTIGQPLDFDININELLPGIHELLSKAEHLSEDITHDTFSLSRGDKNITLHARVTVEKHGDEIEGFIVTFDDITLLVAAQRTAAWADVARRVAHEIKNPLTPIQLAAERLKRKYLKFITEDQENYIRYVDTISKHVGDIGKMVEEFVSSARMSVPVFAKEDIGALVKKAVFSAQVANPGIEYHMAMPEGPVWMLCDERQMTQVMMNVLKNAAEAIDEKFGAEGGKGRIAVALEPAAERLKIMIEDNGAGFPGDDIQKMMEPYVTTRSKGTGLGLSIVKKIVEDHKGLININNIDGGGARVTLSFLQQCDI